VQLYELFHLNGEVVYGERLPGKWMVLRERLPGKWMVFANSFVLTGGPPIAQSLFNNIPGN
jgi:hypothetical protein